MFNLVIGFIVGLIVGGLFGVCTMCLLIVSNKEDK